MTSQTPQAESYLHIVACYHNEYDEWSDKIPKGHVTIRKGYYVCDDKSKSPLEEASSKINEKLSQLVDLCPKTLTCKPHHWNKLWWASNDFMRAHNFLLENITLTENIPYWLMKDIKKSKDPQKMQNDCDEAIKDYGTPWDGNTRFSDIAHMTIIPQLQKENDTFDLQSISVFLGKVNRGQLFPDVPHVIWNVN